MTASPPTATDRRTALLNAAVDQIAAKGARGMRIEEVAKAAGVSPALIYHHFGDRATLLRQALEHVGERADTYTHPAAGTARAMLLEVLLREIQDDAEVRSNSAAWGELRDTAIFDRSLQPTLSGLTQRWVDDVAELVRLGHADGSISTGLDPTATGVRLTALIEGLSARWLAGLLTTDEASDHATAVVLAVLDHQT